MKAPLVFALAAVCSALFLSAPAAPPPKPASGLEFIDTSFENASPLWYDFAPDGTVQIHLLYDHERASPNRAAGHIHFMLQGKPHARITLEFKNLDNVWNGQPGSVAKELKTLVISENGRDWTSLPTESLPPDRIRLSLEMPNSRLFVARTEPYRISDLNRMLDSIRNNRLVQITPIGKTVQGRDLEVIRIGNTNAPHRVFLRARAHAWESGGNWVVEGFIHRLLSRDSETRKFLDHYCAYMLPMANKDGVALGRTRFNMQGKDLNRNWDKAADPRFSPENAALEKWLEAMIQAGQRPELALELHNDGNGQLHISRPDSGNFQQYLEHMKNLEALLRKHTWFTEGSTGGTFKNPGTLGEGWLERFGIDAAVHEFNCNWIAGLKDYPSAKHWQEYGANLCTVLDDYFAAPSR